MIIKLRNDLVKVLFSKSRLTVARRLDLHAQSLELGRSALRQSDDLELRLEDLE